MTAGARTTSLLDATLVVRALVNRGQSRRNDRYTDDAAQGTTVLLTTQYLDEAEHLADRIAILHDGMIIVSGTLEELRKLLPPAKVEYVERQPTLEEIFLAIVGSDKKEQP